MGGDEPQARNGDLSIGVAQGVDRPDQLGEVRPRRAVDPSPGPARLGDVGKAGLGGQVVAVAVDVLAKERDLAVAGGRERPRLVDHLVEGPAPLRPAAERDDAVGAGLVAAVDDREPRGDGRFPAHGARRDGVRAGAGEVIGGRDHDALHDRGGRRPWSRRRSGRADCAGCPAPAAEADGPLGRREAEPLHQLRLLVRAQEEVDGREPASEADPVALSHGAAGQGHAERGIRGLEDREHALATDHLGLGSLADGARVDDDQVGRLHPGGLRTAGRQEPTGHLLRVALVHLAAQRPDPEARERLVLRAELGDARIGRRGGGTRAARRGNRRDEVEDGKLAGRHATTPTWRVARTPAAISGGTQVSAIASAYVSSSPW